MTCLNWFCRSCLCISMKMWWLCWTSRLVLVVLHTHTGTVNAASLLFISAWGSVNMDKVCHAVRWWEGVEREEEKRSKKRREHRHGQKLKSDVTGEKCTASGGCGTLISLLCYIYCWYPITVSLRIKLIQLIRRQQLEPFVLLRPAKREPVGSRWIWNFAQSAVFPLVHLL